MVVNTKSRSELASYFTTGATPTEQQFVDLIGALLNQKDDGLARPAGQPLSIEAASDSQRQAISLYEDYSDPASWTLSLRSSPGEGSREGLDLGDHVMTSRLFIDSQTGNIGIGTTHPREKLSVQGGLAASGLRVDGTVRAGRVDVGNTSHGATDYLAVSGGIRFGDGTVQTSALPGHSNSGDLQVGHLGIGTPATDAMHLAIGAADTGLKRKDNGELAIMVGGAERMSFDGSGNIQINQRSPIEYKVFASPAGSSPIATGYDNTWVAVVGGFLGQYQPSDQQHARGLRVWPYLENGQWHIAREMVGLSNGTWSVAALFISTSFLGVEGSLPSSPT